MEHYVDRHEVGIILSEHLGPYTYPHNAIVLALPRGGVPIAYEVAKSLALPFIELMAVGMWYKNFTQTADEEVISLLNKANQDQS